MQPNPISQFLTIHNPRWNLSFLGKIRWRQVRLCYVKLGYARLMYLLFRALVMDGHNSFSLTSLSLLYRFVNILYIWTLFLLQNTFWHEWTRLLTLCKEFLYIISFDLYSVSKIFFSQLTHLTVSHDPFIWITFLVLNMF
jgi:hypothetical protein